MRSRRLRRLRMGLATLLGRPAGFFIPYRYAAGCRPVAYPAVERILEAARPAFLELLGEAAAHAEQLAALEGPPPLPRWNQDWFPRLDGAMAYTLVRRLQPRRILEIGSGHSTRFMAKALADSGLQGRLACIDPQPRAALTGLDVRHERRLFGEADLQLVATLEAGDMLFIDSSHVAMPGSDVDLLLNGALPALQAGVLVHIHDVFLPDPYPARWAWRGYNEQLLVACLLQGGAFAPLFASHWAATRLADAVTASGLAALPLREGAFETSLWLRKS
ncbi:class I SAM-dependent methyltransferase [Geminicoccaceae bacterium 1502E]|nr:class I SAM-dependent methyltransferase [Geminicoccaceae bacterium 1502E]